MVFHPEQYFEPRRGLRGPSTAGSPPATAAKPRAPPTTVTADAPPERDVLEIRQDDVAIRERPIRIEEPFGELFGVQAEPAAIEPRRTSSPCS